MRTRHFRDGVTGWKDLRIDRGTWDNVRYSVPLLVLDCEFGLVIHHLTSKPNIPDGS